MLSAEAELLSPGIEQLEESLRNPTSGHVVLLIEKQHMILSLLPTTVSVDGK